MKRLLAIVILMAFLSVESYSYPGNPPDGRAGDPTTNATCVMCHNSFALNSGDGVMQLILPEEEIVEGETYSLAVNLEQNGQSRWGFQLTVLDENDEQAGEIIITDATNTQLSDAAGTAPDYLKQTSTGTYEDQSSANWMFDWTVPPLAGGSVTFYLAGVAANGSSGNQGDYVYSLSESVGITSGINDMISVPDAFQLVSAYPNPFNASLNLKFNAEVAGNINVEVFDMLGRLVSNIGQQNVSPGQHTLSWNASGFPSGQYLVRMSADNGWNSVKAVTLLK
jgi:hypothetical protein